MDWNDFSFGNSPQSNLPNSVNSDGTTGNAQADAAAPATMVFDEVSGEFIEIENANAETTVTTVPAAPGDTGTNEQNDWVVYTDQSSDSTTGSGESSGIDTSAGAIDWNAESEQVNELVPPPPPGRSGMKHGKGKGAV